MISIVAISGSLRSTSSNTAILRGMSLLAEKDIQFKIYNELGSLPFFSSELEGNEGAAVENFRKILKEADGVIICTPEYAFGVPGVLKNALDWLVSSGELNEKPVLAISASPLPSGGEKAMFSLQQTLTALGTKQIDHLSIAAVYKKLNEKKEFTDAETLARLRLMMNQLVKAINDKVQATPQ